MTDQAPTTETPATTAATAAAAKPKKQKVSDRLWIDAEGKETTEIESVTGFKYVSVSEPGANAEAQFTGENALPVGIVYALAAFGGLTLAGNVTNTIRNGEPKADGPQNEKDALESWLNDMREGNWTKPSGEVDPGIGRLAEAMARHFDNVKPLADGSKRAGNADATAKVLEWLKGLDKETRSGWRKDPQVQMHMAQINAEKKATAAASATPTAAPAVPDDI